MEQPPQAQPQPQQPLAPQQPLSAPQPPGRKRMGAGKIVALVISICLVLGLAVCGVGYVVYTNHQKTLENERKAAEKARLAKIDRNVELFRSDMKAFMDRAPSSTQQQGINISATDEVGVFEAFFNSQLQDYLKALNDHDSTVVSYHNRAASLSDIVADTSLATSRNNLAAVRKSSDDFYTSARSFFNKQAFEDQLSYTTLPTAAKNKLLDIVAQYTTRFDAALTQAQKTENSTWDAHQQFLDLMAAHPTSWRAKGRIIEWNSRAYYNQATQLSADQAKLLKESLDTLWTVGGIKLMRSGLTS